MGYSDRRPLPGTPVTATITARANNRLGAVYSALHAFWQSRQSAVSSSGQGQATTNIVRRDAYSIVMFDSSAEECEANNFDSTPQDLLNAVLRYGVGGGTNYNAALVTVRSVMETHWSTERSVSLLECYSDVVC